jgi:DNA-binding LytR/AlgR family response regulator
MSNLLSIEILLIEDDELHLDLIKQKLENIGFTNVTTASTYKEASTYMEGNVPDLVLIDYYLDRGHTGVDFVKEYLLGKDVPFIFISSFYGDKVFKDIIGLGPMDFIAKNASEFDYNKSIQLALSKKYQNTFNIKLKDFIFVKYSREIRKIAVENIEYINVDGKYLVLFADSKKFLVRSTLNDFIKKLPEYFIKVHQAYIINLKYLETIQIDEWTIKVGDVPIPFSRNYKKDLFSSYYLP